MATTAIGHGYIGNRTFLKGALQTRYAKFLAVRGAICVMEQESKVHGKMAILKQQVVAHKMPAIINNYTYNTNDALTTAVSVTEHPLYCSRECVRV